MRSVPRPRPRAFSTTAGRELLYYGWPGTLSSPVSAIVLSAIATESGIQAVGDVWRLIEVVVENAGGVVTVRPEVLGQVDVFIDS